MDLKSTCKDLVPLQNYAKNQIYRFKFFEYFQILDFDVPVRSAHHFEALDSEYLMINLEQCFLNTFIYNGSRFTLVSSVSDFDAVDHWITLKYENEIYLVTVGSGACEKSFANLWKFEENSLTVSITRFWFLRISENRISITDFLETQCIDVFLPDDHEYDYESAQKYNFRGKNLKNRLFCLLIQPNPSKKIFGMHFS